MADRMRRNQMTDPDHHHSQARGNRSSIPSAALPLPQPNFGALLAVNIPQVHIPEIHRLPVATSSGSAVQSSGSGVSVVARPPVSDDPFRILDPVTSGVAYQVLSGNIQQVELYFNRHAPLHNPVPLGPSAAGIPSVNDVPQVLLPDNWNAPLQNPIPVVPSAPVLPSRGRGGRQPTAGPLYALSGNYANPA